MKNSNLVKVTLVVITSLIVIMAISGVVKAANQDSDLLQMINDNNTTGNSTASEITDITGNTTKKTTGNNTTKNNTVLKTNNTSTYNNSALPETGIEDTIPATLLVVVFGVSAIYAYRKIQYYKNV